MRHLLPLLFVFSLCSCPAILRDAQKVSFDFPLEAVKASLAAHKTAAITSRRFKQRDLRPLINNLPDAFTVDTAGRSVQDRPLWRVAWGAGPTEVLLWSQMHGNEPTATAALFDLFSWLEGNGDGLDTIRQTLHEELHLTFLPMLNPDGAEVYQRRNALGIDLNRDALRLSSPEARLLKGERDRLDADWGFNLHDQSTYYSAGFPAEKGCVASILAPAYDWEKSINGQREDAMQMIALMNDVWQDEVPGQIGRYNDDFEPRAFGDNLQKWGTRTILIESGGYAGDPEKQEIRRLNLLGLIAGLYGIATNGQEAYSLDDYWAIPENQSNGMHDLKLVGGTVVRPDGEFVMDIGFRKSERSLPPDYRTFSSRAYVSDVGDLHTFGAFETIDAEGLRIVPGKTLAGELDSLSLLNLSPDELYQQGITAVVADKLLLDHPLKDRLRVLPAGNTASETVAPGQSVDLLLYRGDRLVGRVFQGQYLEVE
ncbi:M14 family zinc carboxypeptidase [Neolewinella agarilytica]|uniref:M14 family zinc carboxypeptidase n=1 Tax=Neolewinella agarilytica TaxID=478744 RepID=UPI002356BC15|nr:M14 family zinc carboxypeptidase [Neolewinella agarilytica]